MKLFHQVAPWFSNPVLLTSPALPVPDICLATAAKVIAPRSPKRLVKRSPAAISSGPLQRRGGMVRLFDDLAHQNFDQMLRLWHALTYFCWHQHVFRSEPSFYIKSRSNQSACFCFCLTPPQKKYTKSLHQFLPDVLAHLWGSSSTWRPRSKVHIQQVQPCPTGQVIANTVKNMSGKADIYAHYSMNVN